MRMPAAAQPPFAFPNCSSVTVGHMREEEEATRHAPLLLAVTVILQTVILILIVLVVLNMHGVNVSAGFHCASFALFSLFCSPPLPRCLGGLPLTSHAIGSGVAVLFFFVSCRPS